MLKALVYRIPVILYPILRRVSAILTEALRRFHQLFCAKSLIPYLYSFHACTLQVFIQNLPYARAVCILCSWESGIKYLKNSRSHCSTNLLCPLVTNLCSCLMVCSLHCCLRKLWIWVNNVVPASAFPTLRYCEQMRHTDCGLLWQRHP
jgi:hypothetical protein